MRYFACILAACLSAVSPAIADATDIDARMLELGKSLDRSETALDRGDALDLQALSEIAHSLELLVAEARAIERDLNHEQSIAEQAFFEESEKLTEIFSFLAVVENAPAPEFLLHPDGPLAAARADLIVEATLPEIRASLSGVAQRLADWRELQSLDIMLQDTANASLDDLNTLRQALVDNRRKDKPKRIVNDPMALDSLYAVSDSLDNFVGALSRLSIKTLESDYDFDAERGNIPYPVSGGPVAKGAGVTILSNDQFVKSPFPATVRFAADFLDFGKMVILEPSRDVLVVVAGMDQLSVAEGELVTTGDILGIFATKSAENGEIDLENLSNELYVETRVNARSIDSTKVFRIRQDQDNE